MSSKLFVPNDLVFPTGIVYQIVWAKMPDVKIPGCSEWLKFSSL